MVTIQSFIKLSFVKNSFGYWLIVLIYATPIRPEGTTPSGWN